MNIIWDFIFRPLFYLVTTLGVFVFFRESLIPYIQRKFLTPPKKPISLEEELKQAERVLELSEQEEELRKQQQDEFLKKSLEHKQLMEERESQRLRDAASDLKLGPQYTGHGHRLGEGVTSPLEEERAIRREQDDAYNRALTEHQQKEADRAAKTKASSAPPENQLMEGFLSQVPEEPTEVEINSEDGKKKVTRVSIRFPDGSRLIRHFRATNTLNDLFNFLKGRKGPQLLSKVRLLSNYPKRLNVSVYDEEDLRKTFEDLDLVPEIFLMAVHIK